ncbi:MAG: hypothetical protein EP344_08545, partial [Bacteroidetes bacterium]
PAAPLAFRILHTIFKNRTRLVTDARLRTLRNRMEEAGKVPATWGSAPLPVWRRLATLLLDNGFSLERLGACFECWKPEYSPEETVERLIESLDMLNLTLVVSPDMAERHSDADPGWAARFPDLYSTVYQDTGILLPQANVETDPGLGETAFRLRLNDLWVPVLSGLESGQMLYAIAGEPRLYLPTRAATYAVKDAGDGPMAAEVVDGPWDYIFDWINYWVRQHAGWYINAGILDTQLDNLEEDNRSLIIMIRERWPTYRLCPVLRLLLRERVPVRNLPEILDVLLRMEGPLVVDDTRYLPYFPPVSRVVVVPPGAAANTGFRADQLAGQVRANLKFPVSYPFMKGGVLPCYNFEPAALRDFRDGFFSNSTPESDVVFRQLLRNIYEQTLADFPKPVFLAPTGIRPAVSEALRPYFPDLTVLGHEELPPFFVPSVIATIETPTAEN